MDIDKPLDEIIDQKRSERRTTRGRGRGGARGGSAARGAARGGAAASTGPVRNRHTGNAAAAGAAGPAASAPGKPVIPLMADGSKIIVSNLPTDVTENQIRVSRGSFLAYLQSDVLTCSSIC
jgi:THO complex subunit 4